MLTIRDKQTMSEKEQTSTEEPFVLTILPFVGVGLLLVLAVVWRVLPGRAEEPGGGPVDCVARRDCRDGDRSLGTSAYA